MVWKIPLLIDVSPQQSQLQVLMMGPGSAPAQGDAERAPQRGWQEAAEGTLQAGNLTPTTAMLQHLLLVSTEKPIPPPAAAETLLSCKLCSANSLRCEEFFEKRWGKSSEGWKKALRGASVEVIALSPATSQGA